MKSVNLAEIYIGYIKREGTWDFGMDDFRRLGISGILAYFRLDWEILNKEETEELEKELKWMAQF